MTPPVTSPVDGGAARYAATGDVPFRKRYLTNGQPYKISDGDNKRGFWVSDNDGDRLYCLWSGCAHLNGGNWYEVTADGERVQP